MTGVKRKSNGKDAINQVSMDGKKLPEGWEWKKLEEVCEKTKNFNWKDYNDEKKYIDLTSVSRKTLDITDHKIINRMNAPSRAKKIVLANDVIFATTRPTLKRVTIIKHDYNKAICSTGFVVLRGQSNRIMSEWIYYQLISSSFMRYVETVQKGASYPAVTDTEVKQYLIPLPPLPEQKRIVNQLDKISAEAKHLESIYQNKITALDELKKSILKKAFEGEL